MPRLEVEQLTPKTFEKGAARASLYLGDCRKVLPTLPPFAGSGQIVRAALEYGRSAVGIEIDEERFREAERALSDTCSAPVLFETLHNAPKAQSATHD